MLWFVRQQVFSDSAVSWLIQLVSYSRRIFILLWFYCDYSSLNLSFYFGFNFIEIAFKTWNTIHIQFIDIWGHLREFSGNLSNFSRGWPKFKSRTLGGVVLKTLSLFSGKQAYLVAGKKLVCGCQGEEPAFDFKLDNFVILVEGAIYHRSDLQLHLRRLSFGYKVFKKDF